MKDVLSVRSSDLQFSYNTLIAGVRRSYTATVSVSSPVAIPEPMDSGPRPDVSVTCDDADAAASGDSDCSSFEMLLPDFSSLAIGDTLGKDEPVYSKVQKGGADKNQTTERYCPKVSLKFNKSQILQ